MSESVTKKSRPQLLRILSIKPSPKPEQDGDQFVFKMTYVTQDFKEVNQQCSRQVWESIRVNRPDLNKKVDFVLSIDPQTNVIVDWSPVARPDTMRAFKQTNEDGTVASNMLILERTSDGNVRNVNVPQDCSIDMLETANTALYDNSDISPGTPVGSRLILDSVRASQTGHRYEFQIRR